MAVCEKGPQSRNSIKPDTACVSAFPEAKPAAYTSHETGQKNIEHTVPAVAYLDSVNDKNKGNLSEEHKENRKQIPTITVLKSCTEPGKSSGSVHTYE